MSINIFPSHTYVDPKQQNGAWYQLEVVNMWDLKTQRCCYKKYGNETVFFALFENKKIDSHPIVSNPVLELTKGMKDYLIDQGYTLTL